MIVRVPDMLDRGAERDRREVRSGQATEDPTWRPRPGRAAPGAEDGVEVVRAPARSARRCRRRAAAALEPVPACAVTAALDVRLVPRPATADESSSRPDDLDVDFYDKDEIDVGPIIETETSAGAAHEAAVSRGMSRALSGLRWSTGTPVQCDCQQRPPDPRLAALA